MAYIGYTAKTAVNNANGGGNPYGGTGPDFVYGNPPVYQVSGYCSRTKYENNARCICI